MDNWKKAKYVAVATDRYGTVQVAPFETKEDAYSYGFRISGTVIVLPVVEPYIVHNSIGAMSEYIGIPNEDFS